MSGPGPLRRIAFIGNYPPRLCGIATFTHDLRKAVAGADDETECMVVACSDRTLQYGYPPEVRFEIREQDFDCYRRAADFLNFNNVEVVSLQHEFGIFGGPAGTHVIALLKELRMPVVTTLHTLLTSPTPIQRRVMDELAERSDRLVVMARKGVEILRDVYGVPESKVDLIPHGIPDVEFRESADYKPQFGVEGRVVLFTFGLIGPGKGIEQVIGSLPEIIRAHPNVVYLVLGATHPQLLAKEGERYRLSLERLAGELGVTEHVIFYNRFVTLDDLKEFIGAADIYLTPYLNESQVTSGTLAYVFGAGKPVVSTPYWHAQELLADGRGVLVPFGDTAAVAAGVIGLLDDPGRIARIRREAYAMGRQSIWPATGRKYLETFRLARTERVVSTRTTFAGWTLGNRPNELPPVRLDHLTRMSDDTGIFQHAVFTVPNLAEGYCTDDNARAYILCCLLEEAGGQPHTEVLGHLPTRYLAFLAAALNPDSGRFRNFMSYSRQWLESHGSEDSHGRALWALGTGVARSPGEGHRNLATKLFCQGLPAVESFTSPRAWAFAILGCNEYLDHQPEDEEVRSMRSILTGRLIGLWHLNTTPDWPWFEPIIAYDNARICQALMGAGHGEPHEEALAIGLESLRWLASIQTTPAGCFRPIGSNGFYRRDGARADFDQQPLEAQAMVAACLEAFHITHDTAWMREARRAFEWFLGRNDLGLPVYDFSTGGCCDGLHPDRVNENQGAESTLAFQLALNDMARARQITARPPTSTR